MVCNEAKQKEIVSQILAEVIKCVRARRFVLGCRFKSQIFPLFYFYFLLFVLLYFC